MDARMKVYTVSLIIFLVVLAVSLLFGFSDAGRIKRNPIIQESGFMRSNAEQPDNMPSGLRIKLE